MEVPGILENMLGWAHEPLVASRARIGHDSRQKATELRKPHSSHLASVTVSNLTGLVQRDEQALGGYEEGLKRRPHS